MNGDGPCIDVQGEKTAIHDYAERLEDFIERYAHRPAIKVGFTVKYI